VGHMERHDKEVIRCQAEIDVPMREHGWSGARVPMDMYLSPGDLTEEPELPELAKGAELSHPRALRGSGAAEDGAFGGRCHLWNLR
jgi:hypothetical protein